MEVSLLYKRIIAIVAAVMFTLLALLAIIITDLFDRDFPQAIDVKSRLILNFSESGLSIDEAFKLLEELDKRWNLGLVKVAPDLTNDDDRQIFVPLNEGDYPSEITWFGKDEVGKIVDKERLSTSYPDGFYLVTGETAHLDEFENTLVHSSIDVGRTEASIIHSLGFVVQEKGFTAAVIASSALIASMALFWLSLKAKGRALRVLAGSHTFRIQTQDLSSFGGALIISAFAVACISAVYVGVYHGWAYVDSFLKALIILLLAVILISLFVALIMSIAAWPTATMLATRVPAVKSLRSTAIVIKILTLLLIIATAGPAWKAFKQSEITAAEMAQWKKLSDQVALAFASETGEMDKLEPQIGEMVKDAESLNQVALSYTFTEDMMPPTGLKEFSAISYVNQRWLDLVTSNVPDRSLNQVSLTSLPDDLVQMIKEDFKIWSRSGNSEELIKKFQFFIPVDGYKIPVSIGGGDGKLQFTDKVLVVMVPSLYEAYNDSSLTSMASTGNIVFTGVDATQMLIHRHHLDVFSLRENGIKGELRIVYIAEEGILHAQYAAYIVWVLNFSLIALIIAFTVAAAISAMITAILQAKRDFPLRLSGCSWIRIIQERMVKDVLLVLSVIFLVSFVQGTDEIIAILIAGMYGLVVLPLSHWVATNWCFNGVIRRKI